MTRLDLIEELEQIQQNIVTVEDQVNRKIEDTPYYKIFGHGNADFEHDKEIRIKALAFWKRKFNRTLVKRFAKAFKISIQTIITKNIKINYCLVFLRKRT